MNTISEFFKNSIVCLLAIFSMTTSALAQEGIDTIASEAAEASLELRYTEANNHSKILEAVVKTKVDDAWQGVPGVVVNFYRKELAPLNLIGKATSDANGRTMLVLPAGEEKLASPAFEYTFIAALEGNDQFEDTQEEIAVVESSFEMALEEEDSARQVRVTLLDGQAAPVGEVEVTLYVQRLFGLLPLSSDPETTDEDGTVLVKFPADIPGDSLGNLVIVAKVEDHERFGNLEFRRKINWGVPVVIDHAKKARELWSSRANAPIYLIVFVNSMLIGIWGVILYIVYQAYKIYRIGRTGNSTSSAK